MDEWMELMWLKPSSPRLVVDCLGIFETPLARRPPREGATGLPPSPPQAPSSPNLAPTSSTPFPPQKLHLCLGMIPGAVGPTRTGRHLDSSVRRPCNPCKLSPHYTCTGLIGFIPSPGSTGSHLLQPCHRPKPTSSRHRSGSDRPQTTTASRWNAPRKLLLPAY